MKKVSVSMLAYNEGHAIEKTIKAGYVKLEKLGIDYELWLFDNCSTDNTEEVLNRLVKELPKLKYYRQPQNIGYAFSTRSSMKTPIADIYVTIDGDGQYQLDDVEKLIKLVEGGADIVYANRAQRHDPIVRVIMSSVFNIISRIVLKSEVRDLNCGFRAMTAAAAKSIRIENQLNFVGPEIYVRSKQLNLKVQDVDVKHFERDGGVSVYNGLCSTIKNSIGMFKYLLKLRKEINEVPSPAISESKAT